MDVAPDQVSLIIADASVSTVPRHTLPNHVAIIMDGNGRWAKSRGWLRILGHENGVESVRDVATAAARLGLQRLTLYAFSSENWSRPQKEISLLFKLLERFLVEERSTLMDNNMRLLSIGEIERLPKSTQAKLRETQDMTASNTGTVLCLALSYGSRAEVTQAVRQIATKVQRGELDIDTINEETIQNHLYDPSSPDPDLIIRTAGEMRLSNFLLWQASYAEIYVTDVLWPEFREPHFHEALLAFTHRRRKFGKLDPQ